jgi:predicted dehydrogenase
LTDGPIRVGVVGLGSFGKHHARHYAAHPSARLVAVSDLDQARSQAIAAEFGAESVADHRALLGKVDAVAIAVPATLHHAVAADLIDAGIHVFVEKPIASDSGQGRALASAARRKGIVLQVGHIERFSPAIEALIPRVNDPRRIASVRRTGWTGRSVDVDVILDLMIHDIDLVLTLAGAPVASVAAGGEVFASGLIDEAEAWLTFANGTIATLSASRVASDSARRLTVTQPDAVLIADLAAPSLTEVARSRPGARPQAVPLAARDNLGAEIDSFLKCVATGATPVVDGAAGVAALEVAERIQAAIAETAQPARKAQDR